MSQIPSSASLNARRSRDRYDRCPDCKRTDVDGLHVDRCREEAEWRERAARTAAAYGVPEVTALDLWAHANSRVHNVAVATFVVEYALDLGWRPVVGNDPKRLWEAGQ